MKTTVEKVFLTITYAVGAALFSLIWIVFSFLFFGNIKIIHGGIVIIVIFTIDLIIKLIFNFSEDTLRNIKKLKWISIAIVGLFMAKDPIENKIYKIPDRKIMLEEYTPFMEGTKSVYLENSDYKKLKYLPRIDGATALYPIYASIVQNAYEKENYLERYVVCSGTIQAYENLLNGERDVIFVAGPDDEQIKRATEMGKKLNFIPIGKEAFIFFVNSKNPIDNLSTDDVKNIYSGKVTNWSEVGGKNWEIKAFQRNAGSGSQSALLRFMGNTPLKEPEVEDKVSAMDGIIQVVSDYKNYKNSIGFSFRYYSTEMIKNNKIKLLNLNGVSPTVENIKNDTYPITNSFYAVTISDIGKEGPEVTDKNIKEFIDWVKSEQGQKIIEKVGYVSYY